MELVRKILDEYGIELQSIKERRDYHPEYSLLQHVLTVIDNVSGYYSIELTLAAAFHDLGKIETYKIYGNSYGHEVTSAWIVSEHHKEISRVANFELVWWLVKNHMLGSNAIEGRENRRSKALKKHRWWNWLEKLCKADDMLNSDKYWADSLIGERVFVTTNEGEMVAGICDFLGYNYTFKSHQVTVGRSPILLKNLNQVCTYFNTQTGEFK